LLPLSSAMSQHLEQVAQLGAAALDARLHVGDRDAGEISGLAGGEALELDHGRRLAVGRPQRATNAATQPDSEPAVSRSSSSSRGASGYPSIARAAEFADVAPGTLRR
jgi:hypothetical protein